MKLWSGTLITPNNLHFKNLKNIIFNGEFFWVAIGQISTILLSILLIKILTQYLNPYEYGKLSLILSLGFLISVIPSAYFLSGIERMYSLSSINNELNEYLAAIKKMAITSLFQSLIAVVLFVIILKIAFPKYWEWKYEISISILFVIISSFSTALTSIFNAARKRRVIAFYTFLDSMLKISLIIMFSYLGIINVFTILILYLVGILITLIMKYISFVNQISNGFSLTNVSTSVSMKWKKKMYNYSTPFVYFQLFTWAHTSSDRWALEFFSSTEDAGYLSILLQIGYAPYTILTGIMITYIAPILFDIYGDGNRKNKLEVHKLSMKISYLIIIITLIATLFAFYLHSFIFSIFTNSQFYPVSYLLPWVVLAAGLFSCGQMLFTKLTSELKVRELIKPKIITALIGIAMNIIAAYIWQIEGSVFSLLAFSMFYFLWMLYLSKYNENIGSK